MKPRSPRRGRLSRSAEFERVYRQGRSSANRHLVLYAFPNLAVERPRLGLSVSRKVGGAVERNRIKRLLREAFGQAQDSLRGGYDVVVVARPEVRELVEREGLAGIEAALAELLEKADLREKAGDRADGYQRLGADIAVDEGDGAVGDDNSAERVSPEGRDQEQATP